MYKCVNFVEYYFSLYIYCKRGFFRWGKNRESVGKTSHLLVIFMIFKLFPQ